MRKTTVAAVFDEYLRATNAIDRLLESGVSVDTISLVMSDREADRHFSPAARMRLGPLPMSEAGVAVVRSLSPLAALGTRGTGLVASGPLVSGLVAAGVGAGGGLRRGLTQLGVERTTVEKTVAKVRNNAVLLAVHVTAENRELVESVLKQSSSIQMSFDVVREVVTKPTLRPLEPSAERSTQQSGVFALGEAVKQVAEETRKRGDVTESAKKAVNE